MSDKESLLQKYYNIDNMLNQLFEEKYATPNKFVKFIYYGYMQDDVSRRSEDSRYVLIDTHKQTWEFAKRINDVKLFLDLGENGFTSLIDEICVLIKEEQELKSQLKHNGIRPDVDYSRKLSMALI